MINVYCCNFSEEDNTVDTILILWQKRYSIFLIWVKICLSMMI